VIRLAARALISLLANAVGLVVAAQLLDDMSLSVAGFVTASLIFTVVAVVSEPLIRQIALKNVPAILGSSALIATLASLILTSVLTDGLRISGLTTWVLATVVVWAAALAANLLLPLVIFKRVLAEARDGA
jgi:putative membrane protein